MDHSPPRMTDRNEIAASHMVDNHIGNKILVMKKYQEPPKATAERKVQVPTDVATVLNQWEHTEKSSDELEYCKHA